MNEINDIINPQGYVEIIVKNIHTNEIVKYEKKNTVLTSGKAILAKMLANELPLTYVKYMIFGQNGEDGNVPKVVDPSMTDLFSRIPGTQITVSSGFSNDYPTRTTFSATINSSTANGTVINEAALMLSDSEETLFSMITFGGLTKNSSLVFTLNWTICLV